MPRPEQLGDLPRAERPTALARLIDGSRDHVGLALEAFGHVTSNQLRSEYAHGNAEADDAAEGNQERR